MEISSIPGLPLLRLVAETFGGPITGVSANLHAQAPCRTAEDVVRCLAPGIDLLLDGGPATGGAPSTVLDLTTTPPRIVRSGAVPAAALRPFLARLEVASV